MFPDEDKINNALNDLDEDRDSDYWESSEDPSPGDIVDTLDFLEGL